MSAETFAAVRRAARHLLAGAVLHGPRVTAGRGSVIDWRDVPSGETLEEGADAFGAAQLFVALVGPDAAIAAIAACEVLEGEPPPTDRAACPSRVQPADPEGLDGVRRSRNRLRLELVSPAARCLLKPPSHWGQSDPGPLRWIASGGSPLVFGQCAGRCPRDEPPPADPAPPALVD